MQLRYRVRSHDYVVFPDLHSLTPLCVFPKLYVDLPPIDKEPLLDRKRLPARQVNVHLVLKLICVKVFLAGAFDPIFFDP